MILLSPADIEWGADGLPRSRAFGDVYFSAHDGLAETRTVFLGGCGLPDAWLNRDHFTIAELGFGTGLNFLAAWHMHEQSPRIGHACGWLHYVSTELHPLHKDDAARALSHWPELAVQAEQLLARWPLHVAGPQRLVFPDARITLTLHMGDVNSILPHLSFSADAWFLDGFSPAKNPQMWDAALYGHIARLSCKGTRVATYSVAGHVRRGLEGAGFTVEKREGFTGKRARLEAVLP